MMTPPKLSRIETRQGAERFPHARKALWSSEKIIRRSLNFKIIPSGTPPEFELLKFPHPFLTGLKFCLNATPKCWN